MNFDNKNFILAIVLSMAIIFGWQYFYAAPLAEKQAKQQAAQQQTVTTAADGQQPAAGSLAPGTTLATGRTVSRSRRWGLCRRDGGPVSSAKSFGRSSRNFTRPNCMRQ